MKRLVWYGSGMLNGIADTSKEYDKASKFKATLLIRKKKPTSMCINIMACQSIVN